MEQIKCSFIDCNSPLATGQEIVTGYCSRHLEQIQSDRYFVGVCWQCGNITLIQSHASEKEIEVKDKYIFARGCVKCTDLEEEGYMWMTIKNDSQPVSAVTPTGKIVEIDSQKNQLISNSPKNITD